MFFVDEIFYDSNHVIDVFSAARVIVSPKDVECVHVFVVGLDVGVHQCFPIPIQFIGPHNDFVINVGEVLDIMNVKTRGFEPTVNQIKRKVTSSMPKVTSVIDRYATNIHRHLSGFHGRKIDLSSTAGVMQADGHGIHVGVRPSSLEG